MEASAESHRPKHRPLKHCEADEEEEENVVQEWIGCLQVQYSTEASIFSGIF